jgi:ankyrin repeat protein
MDYVPHDDHKWIEFRHLILERNCHLQWGDHRVPLTQAIYKNSRILVIKFLEAGCDIDERFFGGPPLHYAILEGKKDIAELLLDKGAAPNLQDHHKRSPLHLAIQNGQNNLIERLMGMDTVDLNIRDSDGRTPLHWAVMGISDDLLTRLLKDSRVDVSIVDNDQRSALTYAAYWGHEKGVRTILENSTSLEQHREGELSPVICAAQQGWKDLTLELVTRVPNINQHRGRDRKGLLHWAAIYDWDEVIQVAVDKAGAKLNQIDSSGKAPLHYAAELGNHSATRRLVRCGASVRINDNAGKTAIQGAAMEGFADVLNLLLQESDYDVNEKDNQGCTLLHWAASWDWASIMRIVVDQPDVNLSQRNGYGRTALHIAALCGCPNVMKVLLELDHYDINQTDAFGNTLLHLGARIGSVNVCKEVLDYPLFDRNWQNEFGQSALNVTDTYEKSKEVCTLLNESWSEIWKSSSS